MNATAVNVVSGKSNEDRIARLRLSRLLDPGKGTSHVIGDHFYASIKLMSSSAKLMSFSAVARFSCKLLIAVSMLFMCSWSSCMLVQAVRLATSYHHDATHLAFNADIRLSSPCRGWALSWLGSLDCLLVSLRQGGPWNPGRPSQLGLGHPPRLRA